MKIIFYSENCKFSSELIKKLKETNFNKEFNLINVDNQPVPSKIKVVPTIIDSDYKDLLEGKKAFEYIFNKKYFDNPTNNLLMWKDKNIPKPEILEDDMAFKSSKNLTMIDNKIDNKSDSLDFFSIDLNNVNENEMENESETIKKTPKLNKKQLLRLRGRV